MYEDTILEVYFLVPAFRVILAEESVHQRAESRDQPWLLHLSVNIM